MTTSRHPFLTAPVSTTSLPGGIPFIIGNEAAERFSFYGMKGILVTFMATYLWLMNSDPTSTPMADAEAREYYHLFTSAVYFTPLFGALLADVFLGKYLTIMLLSIVYCLGHGALALMGMEMPSGDMQLSANWFLFLGLGLIAVGSGGIKPCVSAHVGDQFGKTNAFWITKVFGWFYIAINLGAFISNLLTPWLLEWYGPHYAFGIPGVLMAIATFIFWLGRHRFVHVPAGGFAFLRETFSMTGIKAMSKLVVIYVFVAVFWALFDQTGSSWVLQAENLDRTWLGITWLPPQIQAVNPIMILILVPIFTYLFYPALNKFFPMTPIRRIALGLFVMVPGFGIIALLQSWIDQGQTPSIAWQVFAYAILTASEVMVSITCLEFSYTQAPRRMKSFVMALFLVSVSIGNVFTAGVNWYIQVPSGTADAEALVAHASETDTLESLATQAYGSLTYGATADGFTISQPWPGIEGGDQITLNFKANGARGSIEAAGIEPVRAATSDIEGVWSVNGALPDNTAGIAAMDGATDVWGNPLTYTLLSSTEARVASTGPDSTPRTADDVNNLITIEMPSSGENAESWRQRMLDARNERLGLVSERQADVTGEPAFTSRMSIGGGETLEGASYFWFFVIIMLATAVVFVPVAMLYQPKEYLQEEDESVAA